MDKDQKGAAVKFPPPLIFGICIAIGYLLNLALPLSLTLLEGRAYVAVLPLGGALVLILGAVVALKRAKTCIEPWKPTSNIVNSGVFAVSRNPIYVAFICFTIAVGLFLNNIWIIVFSGVAAVAVFYIAIEREERYLAAKFQGEYSDYCAKVRRWL
ncbi:MAG: isoprenylcysteine carboxylmethyltransferase family protein [Pseudomonadales bacterium]|nr:isoprenylcysteine carboxylmethyltransferase family protein [Pseudomonadales bacterium]